MCGSSCSIYLNPSPGRKHGATACGLLMSMVLVMLATACIAGCKRQPATSPDATARTPSTTTPAPGTPPSAPAPNQPPVTTKTYTGILNGNIAAIGGESTGWALLYIEELGNESLEVAVDAVADKAAALEGKRVIVTGTLYKAKLVERGEVDRIRVKSIVEHPQQPAKSATPGAGGTVGIRTNPPGRPIGTNPPGPPPGRIGNPTPVPGRGSMASGDFTGVLREVAADGEKAAGLVLECEQMRGADIRLDEGLVSARLKELVGKRVRVSGEMRDSEIVHADGRRETVKMIWVTGVDVAK